MNQEVEISMDQIGNTDKIHSSMSVEQIHDMISQLGTTENGEPLKKEMDKLRQALLENPAAAAILAPEDIGEAVRNLRRLTGQLISEEAGKSKSKGGSTSKIKVTAELLKDIEDDLFDGDAV